MARERQPASAARRDRAPALGRLRHDGEALLAAQIVAELGLWERPTGPSSRPRVLLNMVCTVDGRATVGGASAPLSSDADRALFHALRAAVDGVLVGAGTVRAERYGRIVPDPDRRRERRERGLSEEPLACVVSGRLELDAEEIPLLAEPAARVALLTSSAARLSAPGARVEYVRAQRDGRLDLAVALAELRERFGVQLLLCEGGPHLAGELFAGGLVDELFLSLSPRLAGGEGEEGLRILAGAELSPPLELELLGALEAGSTLFLRYGVSARERVSRETTLNSSLAR